MTPQARLLRSCSSSGRGALATVALLALAVGAAGLAGCASRGQPQALDTPTAEAIPETAPDPGKDAAAPTAAAPDVVPETPPTAEEKAEAAETPGRCRKSDGPSRVRWLQMAHRTLDGFSCNTALWLDGLLGDQPNAEEANKASGKLDVSGTHSQFSGSDVRVRLRVRIPLPNLQNRLSAFIGRSDEESFVQDRPEAQQLTDQFSSFQGRDEFLAGFGYSVPGGQRLQTGFRVGVRNLRRPGVFTQARFFYSPYVDDLNLVYLRATPFWNSNDGFGLTGGLEYNRFVSSTQLARFSSSATVSQETEGLNWVASAVFYQDLRKSRGIAPELFIRGETDEPEPLQEYGLRLTYRQPVFDRGLFLRFAPGYSWPSDDPRAERKGSANVLLGFELPFGQDDTDNDGGGAAGKPGANAAPVDERVPAPRPAAATGSVPLPKPAEPTGSAPRSKLEQRLRKPPRG